MSATPLENPLTYRPRAPLSDFVEMLWLYESLSAPQGRERLLPDGSTELIIELRGQSFRISDGEDYDDLRSFRDGVVIGVHSKSFAMETSGPSTVIGAHFKPGGIYPFLKAPASELHGAVAPFDFEWGRRAHDLRERLLEAATPADKFDLLERFLLSEVTRPLTWHPAVMFALSQFREGTSVAKVSEVVDRTGYSHRRFNELFRERVGLTPKRHHRLARFQEVLRGVEKAQDVDWAGLALDCGYFDQAHLIHEFREFSGMAPTAYLADRGLRSHHVPLR